MNIVIAMDSFKGSLTSTEAGNAVKEGFLSADPSLRISVLPLADGGEGTIDELMPYVGGQKKHLTVSDALGRPVDSYYMFAGKTAYIEIAKASGITLIDKPDVLHSTTYGTGELIRDALLSGFKKLIVCLGGSATNDGGAGMLQALGMKMTDRNGNDIKQGVIGLKDLYRADTSSMMSIDAEIVIASDVTNPLCGPDGASYVYGPQKGADKEDVILMDNLLQGFADFFSMDPAEKSTGAAGGLSFALKNFLGGKIVSGARLFSEEVGLEGAIRNADIVITGEGRMDAQTCNGKGPMEVTMLAGKYNRPVYAISGSLGDGYEKCLKSGVIHIEELSDKSLDKSSALMNVKKAAERLWTKISRLRDASEVTVSL